MKESTGRGMRSRDYGFRVRHPERQKLLLQALNDLAIPDETPQQSRVITEMIQTLETLLAARRRMRKFVGEKWRAPNARAVRKSKP